MLIATLPPYVSHRRSLAEHPLVSGLRFNTVMPIGESRRDVLRELRSLAGSKPLYIDLKGRQLRVTGFAYLPYAFVDLSHSISVELPATVHFKDGVAEVVRIVDGRRLILGERPSRVVGAGEPVNILDPSLRIEGGLTESDREYVEAAAELGLHRYLLSFAEGPEDIEEVLGLDPEAQVIAKIESRRGLDFVRTLVPGEQSLMAARDDLYIHLGAEKLEIFDALALILEKDPAAIAASRILTSLQDAEAVSLGDLADLELLFRFGYSAFMLSDGLCFQKRAFFAAMAILEGFFARKGLRG